MSNGNGPKAQRTGEAPSATQALYLLQNQLQTYSWGSHSALATLRGEGAPSLKPEAELWMGAHPAASSFVEGDQGPYSLYEFLKQEPQALLGQKVIERFGGKFPFLLKLLAAAEPLSLQAHPSIEQAKRGYQLEEDRGIAITAPTRNYKDKNHKPELICALTPFFALIGFRKRTETQALLGELNSEIFAPLISLLGNGDESAAFRAFCEFALAGPIEERKRLANAAFLACSAQNVGSKGIENSTPDSLKASRFAKEKWFGERIGKLYPNDAGILIALALNLVELSKGEAIYLPAGNLHAYLEGFGVEIMASSDNVLRGGLTPKHVDVPELLSILTLRAEEVSLVSPIRNGAEWTYETPAEDFLLSCIQSSLPEETIVFGAPCGPEILVITKGHLIANRKGEEVRAKAGEAIFVPASGGPYELHLHDAEVFRARCPMFGL